MNTFQYGVKQGLKNISQNKGYALAAVGTISICLFLFGVFYALLSNFKNMVYNVESEVGIAVFFESDTTQEVIDDIGEKIKSHEGVASVEFVSADKAWKEFQKNMFANEKDIDDTFGKDNPLENSASYKVYLNNVSYQQEVAAYIKSLDGVRKVNSSGAVAKGLSSFNRLMTYVSVSIIVLLVLVAVFLINSTVASGIRARKEEISIMKLVGATDIFIHMPFLVEGVVIGIMGAIVPLLLFALLYGRLVVFVSSHFTFLSDWIEFLTTGQEMMILIPVFFAIGIGIGLLGSVLSVKRNSNEVIE